MRQQICQPLNSFRPFWATFLHKSSGHTGSISDSSG